ncbi:hypothetical protein [Spiroplasma endosymbiont of Colias croceus]
MRKKDNEIWEALYNNAKNINLVLKEILEIRQIINKENKND